MTELQDSQLIDACYQKAAAMFDVVGQADAKALAVRPEVRDMCSADRCHAYGKNWRCPPACPSLDFYAQEMAARNVCLVVQTVAQLEDEFDFESMQKAEALHKERFALLRQMFQEDSRIAATDPLFLGAGTCTLCASCSYPNESCRRPQDAVTSMEAAGLLVSDVCEAAGVPYYHGKNTLAYSSCVIL